MGKVLIIDDDPLNSAMLTEMIRDMGHEVICAQTAEQGLREAWSYSFDVVFLDIQLPDGNGLMLLPEIQAVPSNPEVIIITGYGSPDSAELAIKNGAWDFIEKPLVKKLIELPLMRVLQYREAKESRKEPLLLKREGIVGSSQIMESCLKLVAQAAASNAPVVIYGETGTGKELFARAIHNNSARSDGAFVTVDCASLPPTIIESVLFGHEKGAFTGADRSHTGLIKQADGGTLFLDEVGELPLSAQRAFLRVLQERHFRTVGGQKEIMSDFRLVAATNRNLEGMVKDRKFRQDLLFRLRAMVIDLPPLREHPSDIREICFYYVNKLCALYGKETKGFSPEFFDVLCSYEWPGNIREQVNAIESCLAVADAEPILYPKHLPVNIRVQIARESVQDKKNENLLNKQFGTLKERREAAASNEEKKYLQDLMESVEGNINEACKISGLSRVRLYVLLNKHNIKKNAPSIVS
ncbi:MAG: Transcriptional regulatory protein ZraR [Syntrophus sp. SKADARSKE-3]|nr:Transcriptional regulatory protein ZraR [Syntrophus sp. SKADARSKE-3]